MKNTRKSNRSNAALGYVLTAIITGILSVIIFICIMAVGAIADLSNTAVPTEAYMMLPAIGASITASAVCYIKYYKLRAEIQADKARHAKNNRGR